jgi:hypothetical protein
MHPPENDTNYIGVWYEAQKPYVLQATASGTKIKLIIMKESGAITAYIPHKKGTLGKTIYRDKKCSEKVLLVDDLANKINLIEACKRYFSSKVAKTRRR